MMKGGIETNNNVLYITYGLPASGKTEWAIKEAEESNKYTYGRNISKKKIRRFDFDMVTLIRTKLKSFLENLSDYISYNQEDIIVDGMFLSLYDITRFLNELKSISPKCIKHISKISIESWDPDIESCLYNDRGRRNENSQNTIRNAKIEPIDYIFIANLEESFPGFKGKISNTTHIVERKPAWKLFGDLNGISMERDGKVSGPSWCLGGDWRNCWGNGGSVSGEPEPDDFSTFDELLEKVSPNITFLQYKNISSRVIGTDETSESDYYGGNTKYANKYFYMKDLYEILVEKNIIEEL